jgi:hypothetical protein
MLTKMPCRGPYELCELRSISPYWYSALFTQCGEEGLQRGLLHCLTLQHGYWIAGYISSPLQNMQKWILGIWSSILFCGSAFLRSLFEPTDSGRYA